MEVEENPSENGKRNGRDRSKSRRATGVLGFFPLRRKTFTSELPLGVASTGSRSPHGSSRPPTGASNSVQQPQQSLNRMHSSNLLLNARSLTRPEFETSGSRGVANNGSHHTHHQQLSATAGGASDKLQKTNSLGVGLGLTHTNQYSSSNPQQHHQLHELNSLNPIDADPFGQLLHSGSTTPTNCPRRNHQSPDGLSSAGTDLKLFQPKKFFGSNPAHVLGMGGSSDVFAVDPLLQIFVFSLSGGDLKIINPVMEFVIKNTEHIVIEHLHCVPGTGRIIGSGYKCSDTQDQTPNRLMRGVQDCLQIWNIGSVDLSCVINSGGKLSLPPPHIFDVKPLTFNLDCAVQCMARCKLNKSQPGYEIGQGFIAQNTKSSRKSSWTSERHPPRNRRAPMPSSGSSSSLISHSAVARSTSSVSPSVVSLSRNSSRITTSTNSQAVFSTVTPLFQKDGDGSPFPEGNPEADSRWLFFIGLSNGEVRIFDSFRCYFLLYVI
eukprot:Lankesteria_metandrocarpae@DN7334_c0_g1_i1.p1